MAPVIQQLVRIPLTWDNTSMWSRIANSVIDLNVNDTISVEDLSTICVSFATARQFNEALFIDVERSTISHLKDDLEESQLGNVHCGALSNLMWAFAVAGEGSSEFW